jgi:hypothetical protein
VGLLFLVKEFADDCSEFHEFRDFRGFAEIAVGTECSHLVAVALCVGGRHDEDECVAASGARAELAQDVAAFVSRHVDIQEHQVRAWRGGVRVDAVEVLDRVRAVVGDVEFGVNPCFLECEADQEDVGLAVFGD